MDLERRVQELEGILSNLTERNTKQPSPSDMGPTAFLKTDWCGSELLPDDAHDFL